MQIIPGIYLVGSQDCLLTYSDWYSPDCEYIDSNVFAIDLGAEIVLFDCGNGDSIDQILENMRDWNLDPARITHCLLTHSHFDHAAGACRLKKRGVRLAAHRLCAEAIGAGDERTCPYLYHRAFPPCDADVRFRDEDSITIGGLHIDVIHTPGHADGSVVYSFDWKERRIFVTGDLVAETGSLGWSGSIDFDPRAYIESLRRLARMNVDIILPGHRRPALSRGYIWVEQALNRAIVTWGNPR
ncbi:MAG: MBL fold metallo-hydrolase [Candidatus Omnitrophota bacterium]|jgi:glyoxylase-like metal-dependent hydrolase (beta-lactamase superfamily II)|nr:MAG: MBL fold metallo-hydrolase [Candidatus Omnitrophota bacterium]